MKNIILATLAVFSIASFAGQTCDTKVGQETAEETKVITTDVPKHLEGATIVVRLKDGRETSVPAEQFKVVPRKQQFLVTKVKQDTTTTCTADKEKNRISLLGGEGPNPKLTVTRSAKEVTVESKSGVVGGVQYQRLLTDKISVGAQIQSNESALISVGLDF